jgi:hypothetical protein
MAKMVGPTGLLRPLRIFEAQRSLLKYSVKPAGSQAQTLVGRAPIKKTANKWRFVFSWSGRQDLNLRPLHPQRSALPDCATARLRKKRSKCCGRFVRQAFIIWIRRIKTALWNQLWGCDFQVEKSFWPADCVSDFVDACLEIRVDRVGADVFDVGAASGIQHAGTVVGEWV